MESLSIAQARRLALAAQGFADPPPPGRVDRRHLRRVFGRVGLIQIDSVNVLARSHYVAPFSRLGPYPRATLDDMAYRHRELFEYWGHEASYIPTAMYPLFRWHMRRASMGEAWGGMVRLNREHPGYVRAVLEQVRERGPVAVSDLEDAGHRGTTGWGWNWKTGKIALEYLFWAGEVSVASRVRFERRYDLPERVIPPEALDAPEPGQEEAHRQLLAVAARSLGVGTAADLADYFRIRVPEARPRIHELVEEGVIRPVAVEGWRQPAYLHQDARLPRRVARSALLSPFDSLVWFRDRVHRLFGFHYRIEIYVPAHLRTHGYYVLPFLHDERIPARVDLKAERKEGFLRVQSAHLEPGEPAEEVAEALSRELRSLSGWLGLGRNVRVVRRGNLALPLAAALANEA
ncbi:MAG: winged helix DNA-binding domain-containing protein [Actinomycetota bacterium]|nr:winged helix DNA-binding domain-containing protein [Actinomycetota bacterium]